MSKSPFTPTDELRLVDETALQNGEHDLIFTGDQLNNFSTTFLRNLAAHSDSDAINGKSTALEMTAYFKCQRSLSEYERE